jgi:hypothetical protein
MYLRIKSEIPKVTISQFPRLHPRRLSAVRPPEYSSSSNDKSKRDVTKVTDKTQQDGDINKSTTPKSSILNEYINDTFVSFFIRKTEESPLMRTILAANAFINNSKHTPDVTFGSIMDDFSTALNRAQDDPEKRLLMKAVSPAFANLSKDTSHITFLGAITNDFDTILNQIQEDKASARPFVRLEALFQLHAWQTIVISTMLTSKLERSAIELEVVDKKIKTLENIEMLRLLISRKLFEARYEWNICTRTECSITERHILQELGIPNPEDYCIVQMKVKVKGAPDICYEFYYSKRGQCIATYTYKIKDRNCGEQHGKALPGSEMQINGRMVSAAYQKIDPSRLCFVQSIIYPAKNDRTYDLLDNHAPRPYETVVFKPDQPIFRDTMRVSPNCQATRYIAYHYPGTFKIGGYGSMAVTPTDGAMIINILLKSSER